jgi:aminoglycoside 6-adenylyltransferase
MDEGLLEKIVNFASADDSIRAVILEGSLAVGDQVDALSDYDINIYAHSFEHYLNDDGWMSQFGEVLLYQKEVFQFYGTTIPTRLVVFHSGLRIDFSFWQLDLLSDMAQGTKVYESYKNGYRNLVDKDGLAAQLQPPDGSGFQVRQPGRDELLQTIYNFWFEAYCVARYLRRGDVWYAKLIENRYIRDHLYSLALWQHQAENGWKLDSRLHLEGKRFEKWADAGLIREIAKTFSIYDVEATWESLFAMLFTFNHLARQTANRLQIAYPERVEQNTLDYLRSLRKQPLTTSEE